MLSIAEEVDRDGGCREERSLGGIGGNSGGFVHEKEGVGVFFEAPMASTYPQYNSTKGCYTHLDCVSTIWKKEEVGVFF